MITMLGLCGMLFLQRENITVKDVAEFRSAMANVKPGTTILLAPGEYKGGLLFSDVHGTREKPIVIRAADITSRPVIVGGGSGLQFSKASYLQIRDLVIKDARDNGLNIDDGGVYDKPSHHIELHDLRVSDLPKGNHDGIKLSGIDNFAVADCRVERWGGSAIDMVGCHDGKIINGMFLNGGDSGVQMKGGTARVTVSSSRFENYGQRGVNIGGSTGLEFFRPPLKTLKAGERFESKKITVIGCTFIGGVAPISFVGVDGADVACNTIYIPERWAFRILQETREPGFVACRNGVFTRNLVAFKSDQWFSGGANIGDGTLPETFLFQQNFYFCIDKPSLSKVGLPTEDKESVYGKDPQFIDAAAGNLRVKEGSPAAKFGAHSVLEIGEG